MKRLNGITAGILAMVLVSPVAIADNAMSDLQKKDIEKIVHDYIVSNPEVLIEASQALQQKQQETLQKKAQSAIEENAGQLFNDTMSIAGNPKGTVTLVEFFDYQCIHCKKMSPILDAAIAKDKNLRVIYKEFPIFGDDSEFASKAALAASMQGKYSQLHNALINAKDKLTEKVVMNLAKSVGINLYKLKTDMQSKAVTDELAATRQLAEKMHLMGTPAFVIASTPQGQFKAGSTPTFVPGALSEETLNDLIKKATDA